MDLDLIRKLPKTDLHVHLDGSLRLSTIIELARERKIPLPSETEDAWNEGVCYLEPRFAPQLHVRPGFEMAEVVRAVDRGLRRAATQFNASERVTRDGAPPFHAGMILCALRFFNREFSPGYGRFFD